MKNAGLLIIGGGVIGASVAYHAARRRCRDVLVIERGAGLGAAGSTGRATGGFRCQFGTEVNVKMSLLSREKLLRFKDETGVDAGYRQSGYLFIASDERELSALRESQRLQKSCGLAEVAELSALEIQEVNPAVSIENVIGGAFCPTDGFIKPLEILRGYYEAAQRLGVRFKFGTELRGFKFTEENGKRRAVEALTNDDETIAFENVVNAAGAWAGEVAKLAGVELPVAPLRRQVAVTKEADLFSDEMPMTIYVSDGFHFRQREGRTLLLMPTDDNQMNQFGTEVDDEWVRLVHETARRRVSKLADSTVDRARCWAGLYEMSPDKHAIIGRAPQIENLFFANGSSGHGVMHSPAIGQLLAELIFDDKASIDISALRPSRFDEGAPNVSNVFL